MNQNAREKRTLLAEAKVSVFRYLKYRPRSVDEIKEKLRRKDFSQKIIQEAIDYFTRIGSLNDAQFALGWTRSRLNKPYGIHRIRMELKHKGVDKELIETALSQALQDYEEIEAILQLAQRRLRKYAHVDKRTQRRRLYDYLARRGFNSGAIVKTLNQIL